jgi:hypothetical protein
LNLGEAHDGPTPPRDRRQVAALARGPAPPSPGLERRPEAVAGQADSRRLHPRLTKRPSSLRRTVKMAPPLQTAEPACRPLGQGPTVPRYSRHCADSQVLRRSAPSRYVCHSGPPTASRLPLTIKSEPHSE